MFWGGGRQRCGVPQVPSVRFLAKQINFASLSPLPSQLLCTFKNRINRHLQMEANCWRCAQFNLPDTLEKPRECGEKTAREAKLSVRSLIKPLYFP